MTTTNRLISLFAAMIFSATLLADIVYEPLIVDSGFNRDVIAEHPSVSGYAISALYYSGTTSCFATQSVIASRNANQGYTEEQYNRTVASGWPDDYRDTIRCNTEWGADALNYSPYDDLKLFWLLAPYDGLNALCLRPAKAGDETLKDEDQLKGFQGEGTLKFKKIGCYDRLFFLLVSLRKGTVDPRTVQTTVYYTDGTTTSTTFTLTGGLSGEARHKARMTNIYEGTFNKNKIEGKEAAYAEVFDIVVDYTKLIDHISFSNPIVNSSVTILAVTGRTADMPVPVEEAAETHAIEETSFQACWEAITDAASYRLDVAEDIDFQRILEDYNNKEITGTTCAEVADLVANNDYYWRVRSVNSAGGQSASSAPKRVKTAGGEAPHTYEGHTDIADELASWINTAVPAIDIHRTLYRDGYYNTLCLPFNLSAEEIAASPLQGATVFEFAGAQKVGDSQLDIAVTETDYITAGVPYLIQWAPTTPEIIDNGVLEFRNVTIRTNEGQTIGGEDEVRFVGNISRAQMENGNHNNLFIGAGNTLYWPNTDNKLKGFRAYFQVPATGPAAVPANTPARIVTGWNVTTGMEEITNNQLPMTNKVIRDGRLLIIRDGKCYNVLGIQE